MSGYESMDPGALGPNMWLIDEIYRRYREDPEQFTPTYIEFLASGASRSPQELLAPLGTDLRDPETWAYAFAEFDRCVAEAEAGADELQAS